MKGEILEEFDSVMDPLIRKPKKLADKVRKLDAEKLIELAERCYLALPYPEHNSSSQFEFIANSSLSGGRFPCANAPCRHSKLRELSIFAALYANRVFIRDPFEKLVYYDPSDISDTYRLEFFHSLSTVYALRPLIEQGLIGFAKDIMALCTRHHNQLVRHIELTYEPKLKAVESDIKLHCSKIISALLDRTSSGKPFIELQGPEYLIPHGIMYWHFQKLPPHLEAFAHRELPHKFSQAEIIENDIASLVTDKVFDDILFQEWHSWISGTAFLSDSDIYLTVSRSANDKNAQLSADELLGSLAHNVPVIHNADLIDLLKLRQHENESFQVYRDALSALLKNTAGRKGPEIREMLDDTIRPQLHKMDLAVKNWKASLGRTTKNKVLFGSAAVLTGLYTGILPPIIGDAVAAFGGYSAIESLLSNMNESLKEPTTIKENNFYFLWKVQKLQT